jgi:hypothetical protein
MVATLLVHIPLVVAPLLQPPFPPECQLDVLTPMAIEERTLTEFNNNIDAYLRLHRMLARALPMSGYDEEDPFFLDELQRSLIAARPGAQAGEFFTPSVANAIRHRIDVTLVFQGGTALPFRADALTPADRVVVNQPLRAVPNPFAWSTLIAALPVVPPELEYVVVGRDLALIDIAANLVIDVLPDLVPAWPAPDVIYR